MWSPMAATSVASFVISCSRLQIEVGAFVGCRLHASDGNEIAPMRLGNMCCLLGRFAPGFLYSSGIKWSQAAAEPCGPRARGGCTSFWTSRRLLEPGLDLDGDAAQRSAAPSLRPGPGHRPRKVEDIFLGDFAR